MPDDDYIQIPQEYQDILNSIISTTNTMPKKTMPEWVPKVGEQVYVKKIVGGQNECTRCGRSWSVDMDDLDMSIQTVDDVEERNGRDIFYLKGDIARYRFCIHWLSKPTPENLAPKEVFKSLEAELYRKDGRTFFKFSVDSRIEALYKRISEETRTSESWKGLQFYYCPSITDEHGYKQMLSDYGLVDDYGSSLFKSQYFNVAWLRTIGGKGSIELKGSITLAEVCDSMMRAKKFIKQHWKSHFTDFRVKTTINIEV